MAGRPILTAGIFNSRPKLQAFSGHADIVFESTIIGKFAGEFNFISFCGGFRGDIKTLNPSASFSVAQDLSYRYILVLKPTDILSIPNGPAGTPSSTASCFTKIFRPVPVAGTPTT